MTSVALELGVGSGNQTQVLSRAANVLNAETSLQLGKEALTSWLLSVAMLFSTP